MRRVIADVDLTLWQGDAIGVLRELVAESIDCVVTSPPYWGLRDYGDEGQVGLEATPGEYVEKMVEVFRELRRVLAAHGTCWLNLGDSYGKKGLNMIPARVALALAADGWLLRAENVWAKPNPMPESVTDRPTKSHEIVYLLTKSPRYFYDHLAVLEPFEAKTAGTWSRATYDARNGVPAGKQGTYTREYRHPELHAPPQAETLGDLPPEAPRGADGRRKTTRVEHHDGRMAHENYRNAYGGERWPGDGRNMRSVWTIATESYDGAHFAVFPKDLVRRCVLAGSSEKGYCPECGTPWAREVGEVDVAPDLSQRGTAHYDTAERYGAGNGGNNGLDKLAAKMRAGIGKGTLGWLPGCECGAEPRPAVVLDPFAGSGTTGLVARTHGRRAVLIELSADYCDLIVERTQQLSLLGDAA